MRYTNCFYEAHIETDEISWIHITSSDHIEEPLLSAIKRAMEILYYQYGAARLDSNLNQIGVSVCIHYIPDTCILSEGGVTFADTYKDLYLVNAQELIKCFKVNPRILEFQTYGISDSLYKELYKLLDPDNTESFDDMILDTIHNQGLIYAVITDSFIS